LALLAEAATSAWRETTAGGVESMPARFGLRPSAAGSSTRTEETMLLDVRVATHGWPGNVSVIGDASWIN